MRTTVVFIALLHFSLASSFTRRFEELEFPPLKKKIDFHNGRSYADCGRVEETTTENFKSEEMIFGRTDAVRGRNPWRANLVLNKESLTGKIYTCGGTLISARAIATSAGCLMHGEEVITIDQVHVFLGMHDEDAKNETRQVVKLSSVIIHPNYNTTDESFLYDHDLGLLIFNESTIQINKFVKPVCLWNEEYDLERIINKTAEVNGWYLNENYEPTGTLQRAVLQANQHEFCFRASRKFFGSFLKPTRNFCARYSKGRNACAIDTGSGFVLEKNDGFFLRGVATYGVPKELRVSGAPYSPCSPVSIYFITDLGFHMDWIVQNVPDL